MTTPLFNPVPAFELPLSKGDDLFCTFVYMPLVVDDHGRPIDSAGNPTNDRERYRYEVQDFPAGVTAKLVIDADTLVTVTANIDGPNATVWENYTVIDPVGARKTWRFVVAYPNGRDKTICNGMTKRYDGK